MDSHSVSGSRNLTSTLEVPNYRATALHSSGAQTSHSFVIVLDPFARWGPVFNHSRLIEASGVSCATIDRRPLRVQSRCSSSPSRVALIWSWNSVSWSCGTLCFFGAHADLVPPSFTVGLYIVNFSADTQPLTIVVPQLISFTAPHLRNRDCFFWDGQTRCGGSGSVTLRGVRTGTPRKTLQVCCF